METKRLTTTDGSSLSYFVEGSGRPVLLVHGFTMWSDMWSSNGLVHELSEDSTIIAPDLRGHGNSDRPHDPSDYGLKLVSDLVEILEAEFLSTANIVGFSLGAELALKLVTTLPSCVSSIFLIGSGWTRREGIADYREFASWARQTCSGMTPDPDYDALDALAEGMGEVIEISKEELERIKIPCAGLVGGDDPERKNLESLLGIISGFSVEVIPGVPHETSWRNDIVSERVRSFLDRE